jgi:hypothetical protein
MSRWLKCEELKVEIWIAAGVPSRGLRRALGRPAVTARLESAIRKALSAQLRDQMTVRIQVSR